MNRNSLLLALGFVAMLTACAKGSNNSAPEPTSGEATATNDDSAPVIPKLTNEEVKVLSEADAVEMNQSYKGMSSTASQLAQDYAEVLNGIGDLSGHLAALESCTTTTTSGSFIPSTKVEIACEKVTGTIDIGFDISTFKITRSAALVVVNGENKADIKHVVETLAMNNGRKRTIDDVFDIGGINYKIKGSSTATVTMPPVPTPPPIFIPPPVPTPPVIIIPPIVTLPTPPPVEIPQNVSPKASALRVVASEAAEETVNYIKVAISGSFSVERNGAAAEEITVTSSVGLRLGLCGLEQGSITYTASGGASHTKTFEACPAAVVPPLPMIPMIPPVVVD